MRSSMQRIMPLRRRMGRGQEKVFPLRACLRAEAAGRIAIGKAVITDQTYFGNI